jgi:phosphatidylserine/phosphatidylglycerophosphate/cardiolipin synthase-like enzyme
MPISSQHGDCKTYFAPFDPIATLLVNLTQAEQHSIYLKDYSMSLALLTDALDAAVKRGVHVYCLFDHTQAGGKAEKVQLDRLTAAKVPWLEGTSSIHRAILHSKYMVFGGVTVLQGSYNFTDSAAFQANTCSVIENDFAYAAGFIADWYTSYRFIASTERGMQPDPKMLIPEPYPQTVEEAAALTLAGLASSKGKVAA